MRISPGNFTAACITMVVLVAMSIYLMSTVADGVAAILTTNGIQQDFEESERPMPQPLNSVRHPILNDSKTIPTLKQPRLVFLKTHKTASSTVTSVLQRYGYLKDLSFLMPKCGHILDTYHHFDVSKVQGLSSKSARERETLFNFLTNHARYSRTDMDGVFHEARYVTILRDPVTQFESMFYYFEMFKYLPAGKNSLGGFFEDPENNFKLMRRKKMQFTEKRMHNQQLFDLGIDLNDMDDPSTIDGKIGRLQDELDLVMITEYFDESMVLLSKLMHWSLDDLRYISRGARQPGFREPLTDDVRAQIRSWNSADVKLYERFNRTFWGKVKGYGPSFEEDLKTFRKLQLDLSDTCRDVRKDDVTDRRVVKARLKEEAPKWCSVFFMDDVHFTAIIRKRMKMKGLPLYDTCDQR
ncbi:galactosylceramide sulfotransferase-like [Strongylocentrotus purpuratus]|uniref:Galactosylceramide sulfotransferase-like n=1 Tax=Strongylocentrotus purpuratus TaxID=7668 RepID=A0A7M7HQI3_STRPU|nr:galactosylceramide sulfotransferase-like [Strongylocentrotus purpuratus]